MPLWVSAYLAAYTIVAIRSVGAYLKSGRSGGFIAGEIAGDAALVVLALSFWAPALQILPQLWTCAAFLFGLSVRLLQIGAAFRQNIPGARLSLAGKVFAGVLGTALVIALSAPLLFWGFMSAVLGSHAGA